MAKETGKTYGLKTDKKATDESTEIENVVVEDLKATADVVESIDDIAAEVMELVNSGQVTVEKVIKLNEAGQCVRGEFLGYSYIDINDATAPGGKRTINSVVLQHAKTKAVVKILATSQILSGCERAQQGDHVTIIREDGFIETRGNRRVAPYMVLVQPKDGRSMSGGYQSKPLAAPAPAALPPAKA